MPIAETIALISTVTSLSGTGITAASGAKELADVLRSRVKLDSVLAKLVAGAFKEHLPRLDHLCLGEDRPSFDENKFRTLLQTRELSIHRPQDLAAALMPLLIESVSAPGAIHQDSDFEPIYEAILQSAIRGMWKEIGRLDHIANEILLGQGQAILAQQNDLARAVDKISAESAAAANALTELTEFARRVWQKTYHQLLDSAPPSIHTFDQRTYLNPFLLV